MISQAVIQLYCGVNVCAHANEMMVLGAWALRRWLGHVWEPVASVLTEQTTRVVAMYTTARRDDLKARNQTFKINTKSTLILDFSLQPWNISFVYKLPIIWNFVKAIHKEGNTKSWIWRQEGNELLIHIM